MDQNMHFVGRHEELEQFRQILSGAGAGGRIVLVKGQQAMGKTMLLDRMRQEAENSQSLRCTCLQYTVVPTDSTETVMLLMIEDISKAAKNRLSTAAQRLNGNPKKIEALLLAIDSVPLVGHQLTAICKLVLSLAEEARQTGRAWEQLGRILHVIGEKLPEKQRLIIFADPAAKMPERSADAWRLALKDLPAKFIFVFAQRPDDALISSADFCRGEQVVRIPATQLEVLADGDVEELLAARRGETETVIADAALRKLIKRYNGHPHAIQAAIGLLIKGVPPEALPEHSKPEDFAAEQRKEIEKKKEEAISLFEAYAVLEVPVSDEMVQQVADIRRTTLRYLLADDFLCGLLTQEGQSRRIYHISLADEMIDEAGPKNLKPYHARAAAVYRSMLQEAIQNRSGVDQTTLLQLPRHVLEGEGRQPFVDCLLSECGGLMIRLGLRDAFIRYSETGLGIVGKGSEDEASLCANLGGAYLDEGRLEEAERMTRRALGIYQEEAAYEQMAVMLSNLGVLFRRAGDFELARQNYQLAATYNKMCGREEGMAENYGNLGSLYQACGQLDEAEHMYQMASELNTQLNRMASLASNFSNLGSLYKKKFDYEHAVEYYLKSLDINEKTGRLDGLADDYVNLGDIFADRGLFDEAEQTHRKALEINEYINRPIGIARVYNELGLVYARTKESDQARIMYLNALEINQRLNHLEGIADNYGNLADLFFREGQFSMAKEMCLKAIEINRQIGKPPNVAKLLGTLGLIEMAIGNSDKAVEHWQNACDIFMQSGMEVAAQQTQKLMEACLKTNT